MNLLFLLEISLYGLLFFRVLFSLFKIFTGKAPRQIISNQKEKPLSVIITSRNNLERLKKLLNSLVNQNYSDYEIIVVDDCSTDNTSFFLKEFKEQHPNLKYTFVAKHTKFSKALALTVGIKAASKEWLLFLDSSSIIKDKSFLKERSNHIKEKDQIIIGYNNISKTEGFGNWITRVDNIVSQVDYLSASKLNLNIITTDNNVIYRKDQFLLNKGFAKYLDKTGIENQIYCNKSIKGSKTRILLNSPNRTETAIYYNFSDFIQKKREEIKIITNLDPLRKLHLLTDRITLILLTPLAAIAIITMDDFKVPLVILASVILLSLVKGFVVSRRSKDKIGAIYQSVYSYLQPWLILYLYCSSLLRKSRNRWE